jgi:quercetin dioxygenase-like cupin family protein
LIRAAKVDTVNRRFAFKETAHMIARSLCVPAVLAVSFCVSARGQIASPVVEPTRDPGVARATLLDKPQVRVLRVELQPGATRQMHTHDDVRFHLFMPITGAIEFTSGQKVTAAKPGQAFYMDKGTLHGFRNTGTSVAMAYEVFIRDGAAAQNGDKTDALALALAFASMSSPAPIEKTD